LTGLRYLHSYHASRPEDWNRCGPAAAATLLDHHGLDPYGLERPVYDPRDGRHHWRDGRVIDRISGDFPPDKLFGWLGTTGDRLRDVLSHAGLEARAVRSAGTGRGTWAEVEESVSAGDPVAVMLDLGELGGRRFAAHWAVVHGMRGSVVRLANCRGRSRVAKGDLLRAFRGRMVPAGFRHCAVFARRGQAIDLRKSADADAGFVNGYIRTAPTAARSALSAAREERERLERTSGEAPPL
jgi:hypothetical protein